LAIYRSKEPDFDAGGNVGQAPLLIKNPKKKENIGNPCEILK